MLRLSTISPRSWVLIGWVAAISLWHLLVFGWASFAVSDPPFAIYQASAIANYGLLVLWLVLGNEPLRRRLPYLLAIGALLQVLQDSCVLMRASTSNPTELDVFRRAEVQTLLAAIIFAVPVD